MKLPYLIIFLLLSFQLSAQGSDNTLKFKNGIYLTIDEFKSNTPSLPLAAVSNQSRDVLSGSLCMKKIKYIDNGGVEEIKSGDVWGVCINGEPYIRHEQKGVFNMSRANCFYRVYNIGAISTYFVTETKTPPGFGVLDNPSEAYNHGTGSRSLKILEFAFDLKTGEVFDQKSDASKLIERIKTDDHFTDTKIKKKDIGIYITQYNEKHPFEINN